MARKAKPQAEKKMRGRAVKHAPLWQLQDPDFERNHWWMKCVSVSGGNPKFELNEEHPELATLKDVKGHEPTRPAPIVWEVLRRRPEISNLRKGLAAFLARGPIHRVLFDEEANTVVEKLGFGIELLLAVCGLNAWVSKKRRRSDWSTIKAGACPLDGYPRIKFEQFMSAYCHASRAPICIPSHEPEVDVIKEARRFAQLLERRGIGERQEVNAGNALSAITKDVRELEMLSILLRFYVTSGYQISIVAQHPSPVEHPASRLPHFDHPDANAGTIIYSEPDYPLFSTHGTKDFFGLVDKLVKRADPVSNFLFGKFPSKLRSLLEYFESPGRHQLTSEKEAKLNAAVLNSQKGTKLSIEELSGIDAGLRWNVRMERMEGLQASLSERLNKILRGPSIYEPERFADVTLPPETDALRQQKPTGDELVLLNRLLLEAIYPSNIVNQRIARDVLVNHAGRGETTPLVADSEAVKKPPLRRPRNEHLIWVYDIESENSKSRGRYDTVLNAVIFPLMPCDVDPDCKDTLERRFKRVLAELRKVRALWD